jgi:hypothetical protein
VGQSFPEKKTLGSDRVLDQAGDWPVSALAEPDFMALSPPAELDFMEQPGNSWSVVLVHAICSVILSRPNWIHRPRFQGQIRKGRKCQCPAAEKGLCPNHSNRSRSLDSELKQKQPRHRRTETDRNPSRAINTPFPEDD